MWPFGKSAPHVLERNDSNFAAEDIQIQIGSLKGTTLFDFCLLNFTWNYRQLNCICKVCMCVIDVLQFTLLAFTVKKKLLAGQKLSDFKRDLTVHVLSCGQFLR